MTARADNWSPLTVPDWIAVFVAGFLTMFLLFFKFYAGVFAEEIFADRNLELPMISQLAVRGTLPLTFGVLCLGLILSGFFLMRARAARSGIFWISVVIGALGLVATLWGIYAPLL